MKRIEAARPPRGILTAAPEEGESARYSRVEWEIWNAQVSAIVESLRAFLCQGVRVVKRRGTDGK